MKLNRFKLRKMINEVSINEGFISDLARRFIPPTPPDTTEEELNLLKTIYKNAQHDVNLHKLQPYEQKMYALEQLKYLYVNSTVDEQQHLSDKFVKFVKFLDFFPKGPFF